MSYLRYLCLFSHSGVQHILCCVFLRLVYPMLPVSLDCPFLIAISVFSNVYLVREDMDVNELKDCSTLHLDTNQSKRTAPFFIAVLHVSLKNKMSFTKMYNLRHLNEYEGKYGTVFLT